jgi:hypothetical protein
MFFNACLNMNFSSSKLCFEQIMFGTSLALVRTNYNSNKLGFC